MNQSQSMPSAVHPLDAMNLEIEQKGMLVIDDVNVLPAYNEPYISPHLVIAVSHEGVSHGEYDMRPVVFQPHDLSVIYPNHMISAHDSSPDYRVTLLVISSELYGKLRSRLAYGNSRLFSSQPKFHLTDEQYRCICDVIRVMNAVSGMNLSRNHEIIASFIDVLSLMADEFRSKTFYMERPAADKSASSRTYFEAFYNLIVKHYTESREVSFYASQLCLSAKYFGNIIKQETGVSAGEWIGRYVAIRAKLLLHHRMDLTIQQIALQLGFVDASSFARYFKAHTGITAKTYRRQWLEEVV